MNWSSINNKKVTLSFKPATITDEGVIRSYFTNINSTNLLLTFPAYLVQVIPEVKVNGQSVFLGKATEYGKELNLIYTLMTPSEGSLSFGSPINTGSYYTLALISGSVSTQNLNSVKKLADDLAAEVAIKEPEDISNLTRENFIGNIFYSGVLSYYSQYLAMMHSINTKQNTRTGLLPSVGSYGYVPGVEYLFGIPSKITPGSIEMDIDSVGIYASSIVGDSDKVRQAVQTSGAILSYLEHAVIEQSFQQFDGTDDQRAVSAIKALSIANSQGQRIYTLNQQNYSTLLPAINLAADTKSEIQQALLSGKNVITHENPITLGGWTGAGYIISDPSTGDGAYRISGGLNGGSGNITDVLDTVLFYLGALLGGADGHAADLQRRYGFQPYSLSGKIELANKIKLVSGVAGSALAFLNIVMIATDDNINPGAKVTLIATTIMSFFATILISSWVVGVAGASIFGVWGAVFAGLAIATAISLIHSKIKEYIIANLN